MRVMSSPSSVRQEVRPSAKSERHRPWKRGRWSTAVEGTGEREGPGQVKDAHTASSPLPTAR